MASHFPLDSHIVSDAAELCSAKGTSRSLHAAGDIPASGDEIEVVVRRVLKRRLSNAIHVTHGKIVDENLNVSDQLDVIIADKLSAPPLYSAANGSEFVPFESVYAIGEVKATFELEHLKEFCRKIKKTSTQLKRDKVSGGQFQVADITIDLYRGDADSTLNDDDAIQNPLFSFLLSVESRSGLSEEAIDNIYSTIKENWPYVPGVITILKKSSILSAMLISKDVDGVVCDPLTIPTFYKFRTSGDFDFKWLELRPNKRDAPALNLALILAQLARHIQQCSLGPPKLFQYLQHSMDIRNARIIEIAPIHRDPED